jgi:hypothetical protein
MNTCYQGQSFAQNFNPVYSQMGYKGHTGVDVNCGFGSPIYSPFDGYVYKVLTKERPAADGSGFTGVFMIVDDGVECFEWLAGHCDPTVQVGATVRKGEQIATEANHGTVFSGNLQITLAMQRAGDQRGSHRHYQKRPVKRTMPMIQRREYLTTVGGGLYRDKVGYYYEIFAPNNGYNGCTDPLAPVLSRDLWYGSHGYDVYVLQRFLKRQRLFTADTTGFYGPATAGAVGAFQHLHNVKPVMGYCGQKTRQFINLSSPDLLA